MSAPTNNKLRLTVNTGGAGLILDQGKHGCSILSVKPVEQEKFDKSGMETRIQFTFRSLKPMVDEEGEAVLDKETGEPVFGIISCWPRFTGYDPRPDTKSSLSILLNSIFGRSLTPEEAQKLDMERLIGLQGWVVVGSGNEGKPRFDSWLHAKNKPFPNPSDFVFLDEASAGAASDPDLSDLDDPFAE